MGSVDNFINNSLTNQFDITITNEYLSGLLSQKQNTLTSSTTLLGNGASITNISYNNLNDKPSLFNGDYNNLYNKPALFNGDYNNLYNKPSLFSGSYNDLANKPALFDGNYNNLTNKPDLSFYATTTQLATKQDTLTTSTFLYGNGYNIHSISYNNLNDKPVIFDGNYNNLTNKPDLSSYATTTQLANKQDTLTASTTLYGDGNNITNINYNSLTNLPNLGSYATTTQLATKQDILTASTSLLGDGANITNINYNTLNNKPDLTQYATTTQLATKQNTLTAATALLGDGSSITNINYNTLNNKPDLSSYATTTQLANKQDTLTASTSLLGNGANITNINYNNLTNKPDLSSYITTATTDISFNNLNANKLLLNNNSLYTYTLTEFPDEYPPKVYDSSTNLQFMLINTVGVFRSILTFTIRGIIERLAGNYELYCTSWKGTGYEPYLAWNFRTTIADGAWESSITNPFSLYNSTTGIYEGEKYLKNDYLGEFLVVKLTKPIIISKYQIYIDTSELNKSPKNFRIYGSTDAINWTLLQTITNATYTSGVYTNTTFTATTIGYIYFGLVINAISGSGFTNTKIVEWKIEGKQLYINYLFNCEYNNINNKPLLENPLTFNYPFQRTTDTVSLLIDSTLTINANNQLSVVGGGGGGSSQWTTNGTSIYYNLGNIGVGITNPSHKLQVNNGSLFVGNSLITGTAEQGIRNNYYLHFDNSYTNAGDNRCNKIVLYNNPTGSGFLGGFGVEAFGLAYSCWTGAGHKFYTNTTPTSGGNLQLSIKNDRVHIGENVSGGTNRTLIINQIWNGADDGTTDISQTPFLIYNTIQTSGSVLNDPIPIMKLIRHGTSGQSYAARASFKLCRWENNGTNSRTRLDINLAHNSYDDVNVMTIRSDGNVGLGIINPDTRLTVKGIRGLKVFYDVSGYSSYMGFNNPTDSKTCYIGVDGLGLCDIERGALLMGTWTNNSIIFMTGSTNTEKMRLSSAGNLGIGINNPVSKFTIKSTYNVINSGLCIDASDAGYNNQYQLKLYPYVVAASQVGYKFQLINNISSTINDVLVFNHTGNVGIGKAPHANAKLDVQGVVNFHNGNSYVVPNNHMTSGSLTIGGINANYGGGTIANTNMAGFMMECLDYTEIAFHEYGTRINSLVFFNGNANNYHEYGRNMGWGHPNQHLFKCNSYFEVYFNNAVHSDNWDKLRIEPTTLWNGTDSLTTIRNIAFQSPHVVKNTYDNAVIRYGILNSQWWESGCLSSGYYYIGNQANTRKGIVIDIYGNVGIGNPTPINETGDVQLCIGDTNVGESDGFIVLCKNSGGGSQRKFAMGYDDSYNMCIGDYGAYNETGNWFTQFRIAYACPDNAFTILSTGNAYMTHYLTQGSDQKLKTNIRTIENSLWLVEQLRGVYYTRIIDGSENIGLIAQEVEHLIPEVVFENDEGIKSIAYQNLVAVLINAIKEQKEIIDNQQNQINNIMDILSRNGIK